MVIMRRKPQPLIFLAAALALFITAIWQQRAGTNEPRDGDAPAYRDAGATRAGGSTSATDGGPAGAPVAPRDSQVATERTQIDATLALIAQGGPFPHDKDGSVFSNREGRLPAQPRGYYREYTVPTPGAKNRGARRIVRGKGGETYYTSDHYKTFTRID
jgi:ribonuclease T1